jgi:hypothetical protein
MKTVRSFAAVLVALLAAAAATPATAEDSCCHCGGGCKVRKMCRLVCETEVIKDYCYGCECEDFCIPDHAKRGCLHCDGCCGELEDCDCCSQRPWCKLEWFNWCPTCAKPKCVKKLVKYEISREVPSYKWVVETVCEGCCQECGDYQPCDAEGCPIPDYGSGADAEAPPPVPGDPAPMPTPPPVPKPVPEARTPKGVRLQAYFEP